jgi:multiple sugar transport system substrate-binding protein
MRKVMLLLAVLILTSTVVFAGGGSQQAAPAGTSVVRWSFWGGEARIKNTQLATDIFTEKTGIVVAAEPAPGTGEHFQKFLTQFVGGNAADIVQLGGDFSNLNLADNLQTVSGLDDILQPLDPFVRSGALDISKVDASAIQLGTRDGKLYALPVATNIQGLIYNKGLLQRIGAPLPKVSMTWAEWETWLGQVQARLPAGTYVLTDFGCMQNSSSFFGYWAGDNGTTQWDGKQTHLTNAAVQAYLDMWARWRAAGYVPPAAVSADYAETNEASMSMIAGKTVVTMGWSNNLTTWQGAIRDELDLIEPPNAAVKKGLSPQASQMMGINKKSKNAEAAAKFISYRVTDPGAWAIIGADPGTPVTPDARAAASTSDVAKRTAAYLDVAGAHTSPRMPNFPSDSEWTSGFFLIYQNVAYGRLTSAAGAEQAMALINRLIPR